MNIGVTRAHPVLPFWKQRFPKVEWQEGELKELLKLKLEGLLVEPEHSLEIITEFPQLDRSVVESRFVDFVRIGTGKPTAKSFLRQGGAELFNLGTKYLNNRARAYIAGVGPWACVFAILAIEKGYRDIRIVVEKVEQAESLIQHLRKFCFGVVIEPLKHADLNLQPNNGSLLVNTLEVEKYPELLVDLSYLNFISVDGLVIETTENTNQKNPLIDEISGTQLGLLTGGTTRAFVEFQIFQFLGLLLPEDWAAYLEERKKFVPAGNSPSV